MNYYFNSIYLLFISFCLFYDETNCEKCSSREQNEADVCTQKIFLIGDRAQKFRETLDDMHKYCKDINSLQTCVKKYSRDCMTQLARQVTNLLLFGVAKMNKPLCANDANKIAFNKVAKCGNINLESKHLCMDQFIDDLKDSEVNGGDKKIPLLCCHFHKFKKCVRATFDSVSRKKCPQESIDGIMNLISGYAGDALDLICGEYDGSNDKCDQLMRTKVMKSSRKVKSRSRSLLPSFINIFTNM